MSFEHTPVKVVARKGLRDLPGRVADFKQTQTVLASVNAAGEFMPPLVIVKGKKTEVLYMPTKLMMLPLVKRLHGRRSGPIVVQKIFLKHCGPEKPTPAYSRQS